ncbi:MAG: ligase-associated DNA damage response DEXH box helicase [Bacteroidia bacterium]
MTPHIDDWFRQKQWQPYDFQRSCWKQALQGQSGLLNAPTGFGKTFALFLPLLERMKSHPEAYRAQGLYMLWITPLRALAGDLERSMQAAAVGFGLNIRIEARSGDTEAKVKARQKYKLPEVLITTPESLHLMLSRTGWPDAVMRLEYLIVDEWHELVGSKRGVMIELARTQLQRLRPELCIWGISATIGNLNQAAEVLHGYPQTDHQLVKSNQLKKLDMQTIIPEHMDRYPWAGHLGLSMLPQVVPMLKFAKTTLIFTNTRSQAELWYQGLLAYDPTLAGQIALHHGSLSSEIRIWVESALQQGQLKAVVCTSSLDLGVDFRPVEQVIQIGSPKGIARYVQRAGRSGHSPGATSRIYFVPTHALELLEAAALRNAVNLGIMEKRNPLIQPVDLLLQFMMTLACGEGFDSELLYNDLLKTFAFQGFSKDQFNWCINFICQGGQTLHAYDEYKKAGVVDGSIRALNRSIANRHRMCIGTIVSDQQMLIEFVNGSRIGQVEESFISQLKIGDVFWFAGRALELIRVRDTKVQVRKASKIGGKVPSWMGGRMPLSSQLAELMLEKCKAAGKGIFEDLEMQSIRPLIRRQLEQSSLPDGDELLIEVLHSSDGTQFYFYPFEGRQVHAGLSALIAYRISKTLPISFSIAMNDYGFELHTDQQIGFSPDDMSEWFNTDHLREDIFKSLNATEMARRQFGEICRVAGLVFHGYPGMPIRNKHLKASSHLLFDVFYQYEPENLLIYQAFEQVLRFQLDEDRLRIALQRIKRKGIRISMINKQSPFSFPIMVDRLRERLSSESLQQRLQKMLKELEA